MALVFIIFLLPVDIKIKLKKVRVPQDFYMVGCADISMGRLNAGAKGLYSCNAWEPTPGTGNLCTSACQSASSSCGGTYNWDCHFDYANPDPEQPFDFYVGTYNCP